MLKSLKELLKPYSDLQKIEDLDLRANRLIELKGTKIENEELNYDEKFKRVKDNSNLAMDNDWYNHINDF
jgi:hypothetical protein